MKRLVLVYFVLVFVLFCSSEVFSLNKEVLRGGAVDRGPVISFSPLAGGSYGYLLELEGDFAINKSFSIAPRIGGAFGFGSGFGYTGDKLFDLGVSGRFALAYGERPHGLWIGPALDIFLGTRKVAVPVIRGGGSSAIEMQDRALIHLAFSAEFGWRYTFDFGLSLHGMLRLGYTIGHLNDTNYEYNEDTGNREPALTHDVYYALVFGVGYAF